MQVLRARGIESEAEIPFASLLELLRPALGLVDTDPRSRRPSRWKARWRCGPGRHRSASPSARRRSACWPPTPRRGRWRCSSTTRTGSTLERPGAAVRLRRLVADPIAVLHRGAGGRAVAARRRRSAGLQLGGLTSDEAATCSAGWPRRPPAGCTARRPATRSRCSNWPRTCRASRSRRTAPRCWSRPGSRAPSCAASDARQRRPPGARAGRDERRAATWPCSQRAAATLGDRSVRAGGRGERGTGDAARPGLVEFRHPLARSAHLRRCARRAAARGAPGAGRRAARPRRGPPRLAPGSARPSGTDEAASAALEQAGARSRERSAYATAAAAFERAGRLADDAERRARLLLRGGRGGLAGRARRSGGRAARRGPRGTTGDPDERSRSTGWPANRHPPRAR